MIVVGMLSVLVGLSGCEVPPRHIEETHEVDKYLSQQAFKSACVGLENDDYAELRTYTARQLVEYEMEGVPRACLCDALYDADAHEVDLAVAAGVSGTNRPDLARCLAPAITDPQVAERGRVAEALGAIGAREGFEAIEKIVATDPDPAIRAAAASALKPSKMKSTRTILVSVMKTDDEPSVRAAAASALAGETDRKVVAAIGHILEGDGEPEVRAAALQSLMASKAPGSLKLACRTLMGDDDATMRAGAAKALHGTGRAAGVDCLRRSLLDGEDNPAVRTAVMDALAASPSEDAEDALCDLIHPFLKRYVKDSIAEETPGVDIIAHQNDRDHERSWECVSKAWARRGSLSCYGKNHLGKWVEILGGKAHRPLCPGMTPN